MNEIITGVIVAVISAFIIYILGLNNSKTTINIQGRRRLSKIWKLLIVLGWLMFIGSGYYFFAWLTVEGINDYRTGLGLSLCVLGAFVLAIGKFGAWWNRN